MQYLYKQFRRKEWYMTEITWKCFRCNLSFKDPALAEMHKEISSHSVSKIKSLAA